MEQKFKQGDVVMLRSGGEKMTVKRYIIRNDGKLMNHISRIFGNPAKYSEYEYLVVVCVWFENGKLKDGKFDEAELDLCELIS